MWTATTGLNDALDNDLELDGNLYETAVPNLDFMPARAIRRRSPTRAPSARTAPPC